MSLLTCAKKPHDPQRTGYLHDADDDRPFDVDGVGYCGRCHIALSDRAAHPKIINPLGDDAPETGEHARTVKRVGDVSGTDTPDSVSELGARVPPPAQPPEPYTAWALTTTFRKNGTPVMGTMGNSAKRVVVMEVMTFKRMLREHPEFAKALVFNIGEMDHEHD